MSTALALRLIASGAVSAVDAEAALLTSLARRIPFVRALIDTGAIAEALLDHELEQLGGIALRHVAGMPELVNRLPPHFCRRMGVLPVRVDHAARVVEVAAADPLDPHIGNEVTFHLGVPVRVLRAPMSAIEDAIRRIELEAEAAAGRARRATPPFPHGAPESSNPPPPPPEPTPIPLVRKTSSSERNPETLRLYKHTLRPGEGGPGAADLDFADAPAGALAPPQVPQSAYPPPPETAPMPLRTRKDGAPTETSADPIPDAPPAVVEEAPRTLRESSPRLRDLAHAADAGPRSPGESGRLREMARAIPPEAPARPADTSARSLRDSTPRLRDLVRPPAEDKLRDSTPRLRDLARALTAESAATTFESADPADAPLSGIVAADQVPPPGEPPAVSFPSLPPPSVLEQPALLAADDEWSGLAPPPEPQPPTRQRKPSRFVRPAIDIQLPQPPSERSRQQRSVWDVAIGGGDGDDDDPGASPLASATGVQVSVGEPDPVATSPAPGASASRVPTLPAPAPVLLEEPDDEPIPPPQPSAPYRPPQADQLDIALVLDVLRTAGSATTSSPPRSGGSAPSAAAPPCSSSAATASTAGPATSSSATRRSSAPSPSRTTPPACSPPPSPPARISAPSPATPSTPPSSACWSSPSPTSRSPS
ncbi:MAG: hypothetical protein R3F14_24640 [Polyangiaceae bacterium]